MSPLYWKLPQSLMDLELTFDRGGHDPCKFVGRGNNLKVGLTGEFWHRQHGRFRWHVKITLLCLRLRNRDENHR